MKTHREQRVMPYLPDEMFALVADVESYPAFLPWCSDAHIVSRRVENGLDVFVADLFVSFKIHRERFRSEVTLDPRGQMIRIRYLEGPFKYLKNEWKFSPEGMACTRVDFLIEFEFKSRALQMLIGLLFDEAVRRMIGAFETRAKEIYGSRL